MNDIRHKILVLSGKGGVGKSTISSQLSLALVDEGYKVGLLDVDLCGPSIPNMLGLTHKSAYSGESGWIPVYADGDSQRLAVMSLGFLMENEDSPVIWRGPKKSATIRQFIEDVSWGPLDFLIVDTPPGTSDEHISICENLAQYSLDGAIIVTTPQNVSTGDVRKEISFCRKINLDVIGIIENMGGFICPCCGERTNVFSIGGGEALACELNIPFLGRIPIDPSIGLACDQGDKVQGNQAFKCLKDFASKYKSHLET